MTQILTDCNSHLERRERDKSFQSLGYDCFVLRFSTKSEERLAMKEVQMGVNCGKLLKTNGKNVSLRFSLWRE